MKSKNKSLFITAVIALFAAIICVSCFMKIPVGPVPIVIQNVLCVLTGAIIGGFLAGAPTALFLIAGLIGLPVYSGGTSGFAVWIGPTGGFLPGYLLGAIVAGLIAGKPSIQEKKFSWIFFIRICLGIITGTILMYIPGIFWFSHWASTSNKIAENSTAFSFTMAKCVIPFIPGDILKIIVAVPVAMIVRPILAQYLYNDESSKTESK